MLVFHLAGERYAFPLGQVREVTRVVAITRLTEAPPLLAGVVDLRGELVPVLDLRALLGCAAKAVELSDELVFIESNGRLLAFRTDPPAAVGVISRTDLVQAERVVPGFRSPLAIAQQTEGLVVLLDPRALLPLEELLAIETRLAGCRGAAE